MGDNLSVKDSLLLALFIASAFSLSYGQDAPETVAVLDFEGQGMPVSETLTLSERFRTEIANTGAVRLIERKLLEKIMEEQGLQQSGCTTTECAAEVGQLLGAQFMINGSIGLIGNTYTIDVKMISVETGAAVSSRSVSYRGEVDGLLTEMEILAWEINGLTPPERLFLKRTGGETATLPTVAILDFEGRGIALLEAQTLTDRFSTEIGKTRVMQLVERRTMNEVLDEQGFSSEGCTSDECAAEVGALLGVQYMISGAIGKVGNTYTLDAKMFSVSTGAAEKTKNVTYTGPVDGLITEIEILAWSMMGSEIPADLVAKKQRGVSAYQPRSEIVESIRPKTRMGALIRSTFIPGAGQFYSGAGKWGRIWLGSELLIGTAIGISYAMYSTHIKNYNSFKDQYQASTDPAEIKTLRDKSENSYSQAKSFNDLITYTVYAGAGIWVLNMVHAFATGPSTELSMETSHVTFSLDVSGQQAQVNFYIPLR